MTTRSISYLFSGFILLLSSCFIVNKNNETKVEEEQKTVKETPQIDTTQITWLSFEEAISKSNEEPKKLFIDVYADWCGWCKRMDQTTFTNTEIIKYINTNFYPVKLNGEMKEPVMYKGKEYKFVQSGRRGYHELPATLMNGKMSYPTVIFLDEQKNEISPVPGYKPPRDMYILLKFFAEEHYKTTDWRTFAAQCKTPMDK